MSLGAALLVLLAGLGVGATSIGGVLVVPVLTAVAQVPVGAAIAASSFSFLFTGAAGLLQMRAAGRGDPAGAGGGYGGFYVAALLGAGLGAFTLQWIPATAVRLLVAVLAVLSGAMALRGRGEIAPVTVSRWSARGPAGALVGACVGITSTWSGTGGPILLVPLLMLARAPVVQVISLAQGIQLPIAGAATLVNLAAGRLDVGLGLRLGLILIVGWWIGWRVARHVPAALLRRVVALGLLAVGLWYGWQTLRALPA